MCACVCVVGELIAIQRTGGKKDGRGDWDWYTIGESDKGKLFAMFSLHKQKRLIPDTDIYFLDIWGLKPFIYTTYSF